jgi:hypothetical protein
MIDQVLSHLDRHLVRRKPAQRDNRRPTGVWLAQMVGAGLTLDL